MNFRAESYTYINEIHFIDCAVEQNTATADRTRHDRKLQASPDQKGHQQPKLTHRYANEKETTQTAVENNQATIVSMTKNAGSWCQEYRSGRNAHHNRQEKLIGPLSSSRRHESTMDSAMSSAPQPPLVRK